MANYQDPYKFNIVLNSLYISLPASGNNNDCSYEFNWTNIPRGKYHAYLVASDSPQVFLSITSVPSVYEANGEYGSNISNFIGSLRIDTHAAAQAYFYANLNDNPDVFFNNTPTNGLIRVKVFRDDFSTPFRTITGGFDLANYVMVLSFTKINE